MNLFQTQTIGTSPQINNRKGLLYSGALSFIFLMFFPNIDIIDFGDTGSSIKMYHFYGIFVLLLLPIEKRNIHPPLTAVLFFVSALLIAILNGQRFGFDGRIVTLLYSLVFFYYFFCFACAASYEKVLFFLQNTTLLLYAAVFIKSILLWNELQIGYMADIYCFFPGGKNIESTWIALFLSFFIRKKAAIFLMLSLYAMTIALLYESRTSQLLVVIIAILYGAHRCNPRIMYGFFILGVIGMTMLLLSVDYDAITTIAKAYGVGRFSNIGDGDGFAKRVMMWGLALPHIQNEWLFGNGIGNIIPLIRPESELNIFENNLHNIYIQLLAELGIIPLIMFVCFILYVMHIYFTRRTHLPELALFIFGYAVAGVVQFTGFEILFWAVVGLYSGFKLKRSAFSEATLEGENRGC